jgi:hypothetical protein
MPSEFAAVDFHEMARQRNDVVAPLAKRRQAQWCDIDPIVQVASKVTRLHGPAQVVGYPGFA